MGVKHLNLEQIRRALKIAFAADVPVALWGPPGVGKSSIIAQLAEELGWTLYDIRLSDKEPADIGGIPYPVDGRAVYLMPAGMPFDSEEFSILLMDEYDRADLAVQGSTLQITLDRKINGHRLSPNCRVIVAGNGMTDIGTTPMSKAAGNRLLHLYVEVGTKGALDSYLEYADTHDVHPLLTGFAQVRQEVWANGSAIAEMEEIAYATPRSFDMAAKILAIVEASENTRTKDILPAMIAGCVGEGAATEFLAYRDLFNNAPSVQQILHDPEHTEVPERPDIMYVLTGALSDASRESREVAEKVAIYGLRWPEEPAAYLFRKLAAKQPLVMSSIPYMKWNKGRLHKPEAIDATAESVERGQLPKLIAGLKDLQAQAVPDNDLWVNRVQITSESGHKYILSQSRRTVAAKGAEKTDWACSCPGWTTRRTCKHLDRLTATLA